MSEPRTIRFSRADVIEALPDYLLARGGQAPPDLHPVAEDLVDPISPRSLADIACHLAGTPDLGRALTTSDFGTALGKAMSQAVAVSYAETAGEHVPLLRDVVARDLRPIALPTIDLGDLLKVPDGGGPVQVPPLVTGAGVTGRAYLWSAALLVGRALLLGDDAGLIAAALAQLGASAARVEAQQIASVLEANPTLGDGSALFVAANTASGGATAGLANALALLRTAKSASGATLNLRGALWLVAPAEEVAALTVVRNISTGEPRLQVIVNGWLTAGTSYVLASPATAPVLTRIALTPGAPPRVEQRRPLQDYDGLAYRVEHFAGITAAGRSGIVKLST